MLNPFSVAPGEPAVFALYSLIWVLAFLAGLALGSLVSAIWLRLAVQWLGFQPISYLGAFKSALIANFSVLMFHIGVGLNFGLTQVMNAIQRRGMDPQFQRFEPSGVSNHPPIFFLYAAIFGLVLTAAIFSRTIPAPKEEPPLNFTQSLSIAAFYQALSLAIMAVLALIAYLIAAGWSSML
jgi:hypothetical protein